MKIGEDERELQRLFDRAALVAAIRAMSHQLLLRMPELVELERAAEAFFGEPFVKPERTDCTATLRGFQCNVVGEHVRHTTDVPGFRRVSWYDADLFRDGEYADLDTFLEEQHALVERAREEDR